MSDITLEKRVRVLVDSIACEKSAVMICPLSRIIMMRYDVDNSQAARIARKVLLD